MKVKLIFLTWVFGLPILFAQPNFSESGAAFGIMHSYGSGAPGGGISLVDFNNDGWDDLTLGTGGDSLIHFYINRQGVFERIPALVDNRCEQKQILWADYDNDGDLDLFVACYGDVNRLYRNDEEQLLLDVTEQSLLPLEDFLTYGSNFVDINRDGWLDLYYVERRGPIAADQNRNRLFLNGRDGTFNEISEESGISDPQKKPFCSTFFDYNNDAWPDLYTANDKLTINTLLQNMGDRTFSDVSMSTGTDLSMNAMCVTVGDYDNDGWQDIYVTNTQEGARLFHNLGGELGRPSVIYEEVADAMGVNFGDGIGWGSVFIDAENDGDLDLYVSGSLIGSNELSAAFYENIDGAFFTLSEAGFIGDTVLSYSSASGDLDNDGLTDIVVSNHDPFKTHFWHNRSNGGLWLKVKLQGVVSNRSGIGCRLALYAGGISQMRYVHCGIGFLGQNSNCETFGLGSTDHIDSLVINWPTGHKDRIIAPAVNQTLAIVEGSTTAGIINVDPDIRDIVTAANEVYLENHLTYFPNPVAEQLRITLPTVVSGSLTLHDGRGALILNRQIRDQRDIVLHMSNLESGLYFLRFISSDHRLIASAKCIKN